VEWQEELQRTYWEAVEMRPHFPGAPLVRIRGDWRENTPPRGPVAALFRKHLADTESVLDVGAGDRYWKDVLIRLGIDARYRSVDLETRHDHDYADFLAVGEMFDAILMLELLEHLPLELGVRFIEHAARLLNPGGTLIIGTPNPRHAHQVWSADFTHIRPWPAHDIWAVCKIVGFERVDVYRQMISTPKRDLALPLQLALSKLLGLDPAYGLLAFAVR
jgi:2-polyprenyl-3-methyl-5-hydroxy-6-metoxy-1,4-benzoquinol methylase